MKTIASAFLVLSICCYVGSSGKNLARSDLSNCIEYPYSSIRAFLDSSGIKQLRLFDNGFNNCKSSDSSIFILDSLHCIVNINHLKRINSEQVNYLLLIKISPTITVLDTLGPFGNKKISISREGRIPGITLKIALNKTINTPNLPGSSQGSCISDITQFKQYKLINNKFSEILFTF